MSHAHHQHLKTKWLMFTLCGIGLVIVSGILIGSVGRPEPVSAASGPFQEQNGIVVIEMESVDHRNGWVLGPDENPTSPDIDNPGNASNDQFIVWEGTQYFSSTGNGLLEYEVEISTPGTYHFDWRTQVGNGNDSKEHNDTWVKINADSFYAENGNGSVICPKGYDPDENDCTGGEPRGRGANGYFKVYISGSTNWTWSTNTNDISPYNKILARFDSAGTYTIQVSARSSGHVLDRMVLWKTDYNGNAQSLSLPESPRSGGGPTATPVTPTSTSVPPTSTPITPTSTSIPPTATATSTTVPPTPGVTLTATPGPIPSMTPGPTSTPFVPDDDDFMQFLPSIFAPN